MPNSDNLKSNIASLFSFVRDRREVKEGQPAEETDRFARSVERVSQTIEQSNFIIHVMHVKSHQELRKCKQELSHEEGLNILADQLTKDARQLKAVSKYEFPPINQLSFFPY